MKTKLLISAFLLSFVPLLWAENNLKLTYGMLKKSRYIEALVNNDGISYKIILRESYDGKLEIESPPFLSASFENANNTIRIGEFNEDRILRAMIDPYADVDLTDGFLLGKNLNNIESPSIEPSVSGIAMSLKNLDLISFNPMMNKKSPSGFAAITGTERTFAGIMFASQNEIFLRTRIQDFQVNWSRTGYGKSMLFWIIGASDKFSYKGLDIESSSFLQSSYDRLLGGGSTTNWTLSVSGSKLGLNASRALGGIGPTLRRISETQRPIENLSLGAVFKDNDLSLEAKYVSETYEKPLYGGHSQIRTIELKTAVKYGKLKIEANHSKSFNSDFAKIEKTVYKVTADYQDAKLEMNFTLRRDVDQKPTLGDLFVESELPHAKLKIQDGKTELKLSMERKLDECILILAIDQDRLFSASLVFKN